MVRSSDYDAGFSDGIVALITRIAKTLGDTPVTPETTVTMATIEAAEQDARNPTFTPGLDPE